MDHLLHGLAPITAEAGIGGPYGLAISPEESFCFRVLEPDAAVVLRP